VAERLAERGARNVVLDPVMVSKSGAALLLPDAIEALRQHMIPLAAILTPNLPEAAALLAMEFGAARARPVGRLPALARPGLPRRRPEGGHAGGDDSDDLYFDGARSCGSPPRRISHEQHARHRLHVPARSPPTSRVASLTRGLPSREALRHRSHRGCARVAHRPRPRTGAPLPRTLAQDERLLTASSPLGEAPIGTARAPRTAVASGTGCDLGSLRMRSRFHTFAAWLVLVAYLLSGVAPGRGLVVCWVSGWQLSAGARLERLRWLSGQLEAR
jgi:hypothetical protein